MPLCPSNKASLQAWLDYLLAIHPTEIDMELTRVRLVAERMGLLDLGNTQVITVAGTNGKGTTCALIENILRQANFHVGLYTSPHLVNFNERIRINGVDLDDFTIVDSFSRIEKIRDDISLTFFEYVTLAALDIFKQANLDFVILEVGLGGRLDATNIINADVAVITAIDLDHQAYLGDTREAVAREKAGIFKANQRAICGDPEMPEIVLQLADAKHIPLLRVNHDFSYSVCKDDWEFTGKHWHLRHLPEPKIPLANAATALATLELIEPKLSLTAIKNGLRQTFIPGRFEVISKNPMIILDVAHNPHAARYLSEKLKLYSHKPILALCGMLKDKDISGVMSIMSQVVDTWYLTDLAVERGAEAKLLADNLPENQKFHCFTNIKQAWTALKYDMHNDDVVIVFGSFYTVSGAKLLISEE